MGHNNSEFSWPEHIEGSSDLHVIHLPSTPLVPLGSPQATSPACCLKIFIHSALRDLQNAPLLSQVMPASSDPSLGMLCPSLVRKKLPNRELAMVCASPAPPQHPGPHQGTAVSSETTAGTSCTWGQVWHKDLLRKFRDSLWCWLYAPPGHTTIWAWTWQLRARMWLSQHNRKGSGCRNCTQLQTLLCLTWSCRSTSGWTWLWAGWCYRNTRAKRGWKHSWKAQQSGKHSRARGKEERTRSQMSAGSATWLQGMPAQVWLAKVKKYPWERSVGFFCAGLALCLKFAFPKRGWKIPRVGCNRCCWGWEKHWWSKERNPWLSKWLRGVKGFSKGKEAHLQQTLTDG